jgi:hypothetical protein
MSRGLAADRFQASFEAEFAPVADGLGMVRRSGRRLCWQLGQGPLSMAFDFALNPRAAKSPSFLPGEFALTISLPGNSNHPLASMVSLFQYATDAEVDGYVAAEGAVVGRFLAANPDLASLFREDPRPAPNVSQWCHYLDAGDVDRWARWYAAVVPAFIPRYQARPESLEDWCWRVLWADQDRHGGAA